MQQSTSTIELTKRRWNKNTNEALLHKCTQQNVGVKSVTEVYSRAGTMHAVKDLVSSGLLISSGSSAVCTPISGPQLGWQELRVM